MTAYQFGQGYYEADAGDTYTFKYTYGNGDYYTGKFYYNPAGVYYYPGWKSAYTVANETGQVGNHEITGVSYTGVAATDYGKVFVTGYYDGDASKLTLTPVNSTTPATTLDLGNEKGYIKKAGVAAYLFSRYYEADAGDTYTFKYTYGNGDYYTGKFYYNPAGVYYYPGWKSAYTVANETGKVGSYEITGVSYSGVAATDYGKVFVTGYYDGDASKLTLTPVNSTTPATTLGLGNEKGYIKQAGVKAYLFSRYYEADAGDTYTFKYTYGNGDYYTGKFYYNPAGVYYYPGWKSAYTVANETGQVGSHEITGMSYSGVAATDYGKVYRHRLLRRRRQQINLDAGQCHYPGHHARPGQREGLYQAGRRRRLSLQPLL